MALHYARFVRSNSIEDVEKRTVSHFYGWKVGDQPVVGDQLVAIPTGPVTQIDIDGEQAEVIAKPWRRGLARLITSVTEVRLLEVLTFEELAKLDIDIDAYLQVWDKLHPDALAKTNPLVVRVEVEPEGHIVDLPESAETQIVYTIARRAYDEMTAIEDARAFGDIEQALCQ